MSQSNYPDYLRFLQRPRKQPSAFSMSAFQLSGLSISACRSLPVVCRFSGPFSRLLVLVSSGTIRL